MSVIPENSPVMITVATNSSKPDLRIVDGDNKCAICLDTHANSFVTLACNHQLHTPCYEKMCNMGDIIKCPNCRAVHIDPRQQTLIERKRTRKIVIALTIAVMCFVTFVGACVFIGITTSHLKASPEDINDKYNLATYITAEIISVTETVYTQNETMIEYTYKSNNNTFRATVTNAILNGLVINVDVTTFVDQNQIFVNQTQNWFQLNSVNPLLSTELVSFTEHKYADYQKSIVEVLVMLSILMAKSLVMCVMNIALYIQARSWNGQDEIDEDN